MVDGQLNPTRPNSARGWRLALVGTVALFFAFLSYPFALSQFFTVSIGAGAVLEPLAYGSLGLILGGLVALGLGSYRALALGHAYDGPGESVVLRTLSAVAHVLGTSRYRRVLIIAALAYGTFLAFTSGTVVYQPAVQFSEAYDAHIPSSVVVLCCGPLGQVPRFVVYLTEHVGLLLVPINLVLLVLVSSLVGLNMALAALAYANRPQVAKRGWFAAVGGVIGLFTGCPACASLLFASNLAGLGAVGVTTVLASLQTVLVAISLPVLGATPFLLARSGLANSATCPLPDTLGLR